MTANTVFRKASLHGRYCIKHFIFSHFNSFILIIFAFIFSVIYNNYLIKLVTLRQIYVIVQLSKILKALDKM